MDKIKINPCNGYNYSYCLDCLRESKVLRPDNIELGTDFIEPNIRTFANNVVECDDYIDIETNFTDSSFIGNLISSRRISKPEISFDSLLENEQSVIQILKSWLISNNCDGLMNIEIDCRCGLSNLISCRRISNVHDCISHSRCR